MFIEHPLYPKHLTLNSSFAQVLCEICTILIISTSISKLRDGEANFFYFSNAAKQWPSQDLNPGHLASEAALWIIFQYCLYHHVQKNKSKSKVSTYTKLLKTFLCVRNSISLILIWWEKVSWEVNEDLKAYLHSRSVSGNLYHLNDLNP